jgi:hypothetical protein
MAGRIPDFRVAIMDKVTDEKNGSVGAGWINDDGTISITFECFINFRTNKDLLMTLFPRKEKAP